MTIFNVLSLLGGLAMFLFGMDVMGKALQKQAGYRMKNILEKLTSSPIRGVLLGTLITAVIQSSSATTVMVVGFVNSGLMTVAQATGVVMGANIGTTITAWILSLAGIEGDSLLLQLLKPSSFTPVLAVIGIVILLGSKKQRKQNVGVILLGFAVLMFGMETMSAAVAPLKTVPEFTGILLKFSNPILGVLAGAALTAVIQSSSASIGILQALALATGSITFSSAIPIMMGMNIGTCITAMLSSVGAGRDARMVALIHLYFNIIGVAAFLCLFYAANAVFTLGFTGQAATPVGIAVVNTVYKAFAVAIMLPFSKQLQRLAAASVPEKKSKSKLEMLDRRLLSTPSVALDACRGLAGDMARGVHDICHSALELTGSFDDKLCDFIREGEDKADVYEDKLGTYLVELSGANLTQEDGENVSMLLHVIGDLERISDHAVNVVEAAEELQGKGLSFSEEAQGDLRVLCGAVGEILDMTVDAFRTGDAASAHTVEPLEEVIDELCAEIKKKHIMRLQEGRCTIELGFVLSDLLSNLERIADHCSNIAICLIEIGQGVLLSHAYTLALGNDQQFKDYYGAYRAKYTL